MRDQFVSLSPSRRERWKGHDSKEGVRRAIAYAERHPWVRDLRIFAVGEEDGWVVYTEIPSADWPTYFAESEA